MTLSNIEQANQPFTLSVEDRAFIVAQSGQLFSIHNQDYKIIYVSPTFEALLGYSTGELLGKPYADLFSFSDYARLKDTLGTLLKKPAPVSDMLLVRQKSGKSLWAMITVQNLPSASGHASAGGEVRQLAVYQDLNQLKHLQDVIDSLAFDPTKLTDTAFFEPLISRTAAALDVDYAFVTVTQPPYKSVRMLAFWQGEQFAKPYEYDLDDTPCDRVIRHGEVTHVPLGVQAYYPKDQDLVALNAQSYLGVPIYDHAGLVRGHLALLDRLPLKMTDFRRSLTTIFARQVSIALETLYPYSDKPSSASPKSDSGSIIAK